MRILLGFIAFSMLLLSSASSVVPKCDNDQVYCKNGRSCIAKSKLCDGNQDCVDNSDEENCDLRDCEKPYSFKCNSGGGDFSTCIPIEFVCNEIENCPGGEDELNCKNQSESGIVGHRKCSVYEFKCDEDKKCIPVNLRCDGKNDCQNGSDETAGCWLAAKECSGFFCSNKKCLESRSWVCDGVDDCGDGSDEANCKIRNCNVANQKFLCRDNNNCIDLNKTCDGKADCPDESDESGLCATAKDDCSSKKCPKRANCMMTPSAGPICVCLKGFRISAKNNSCVDIDECQETYGLCDHGCVNTQGSYRCTCSEYYGLKLDGRTCIAFDQNVSLFYTTQAEVYGIHLRDHRVYRIADNLTRVIGVSSDAEKIYWSNLEEENKCIVKANKDGSNQQTLLTAGLEAPEDLAIDWLTENIYFTDKGMQHIAVCSNDGEWCTVLVVINVHHPRGIALWPQRGQMFWSDWGSMPMIARASMDGENSVELVKEKIHWPNGIALDMHNERLYWVDAKLGTMESIRPDGSDRRIILNDIPKHPYGIAIFENSIYWSDWITKSIHKANKFTGKNHSVLVRDIPIYAINIFHPGNQPHYDHSCQTAYCTHLCLLAENNRSTCACPDGMILATDKIHCIRSKKKQRLFLGIRNYLVEIEHTEFGRHKIIDSHAFPCEINEMAYNNVNGTIVFADNVQRVIYEFDESKNKLRKLVDNHLGMVTGLSFDYLAHNLYWTDEERRVIEVYSFTTQYRAIVSFFPGSEKPIGLSVIPEEGIMFVALASSESNSGRIEQRSLNGKGASIHKLDDGLGESGIKFAVDYETQKLFWVDTKFNRISFSDFKSIHAYTFRNQLKRPYSLAIVDDDIFWSQIDSPLLYWTHRSNLGSLKRVLLATPKYLYNNFSLPSRIPLVSSMKPIFMDHPCQHGNGCSHICVTETKFFATCLCPIGWVFKDSTNKTCIETLDCEFRCKSGECLTLSRRCNGQKDCRDHSDEDDCHDILSHNKKLGKLSCALDEFACHDGTRCIDNESRCDAVKDCRDGSDEVNCGESDLEMKCHRHQHICNNGQCVDFSSMCDGFDDCGDNSDENNCYDRGVIATFNNRPSCGNDMFQCVSGTCIAKSWECDGKVDCPDGSDEHGNCELFECPVDMKKCIMGQCIDEKLICDGHNDCGDNSDEVDCDFSGKRKIVCGDEGREKSKLFQCPSDPTICLKLDAICNGTTECPRGEDEIDCHGCGIYEFECVTTKECIFLEFHCDNEKDCSDGSDEVNCQPQSNFTKDIMSIKELPCKPGMFDCKDGRCIDPNMVCDGIVDCESAADELGLCPTACSIVGHCEQKCRPTPSGGVCSCHHGYKLQSDNRKCADINECDEKNPCAQICTNIPGSYRCSCFPEFMLRTDKISCKSIERNNTLLFSTFDEVRSFREYPIALKVLWSSNSSRIIGLDVNIRERLAYFTSVDQDILYEVDLKTGVIRSGLFVHSPKKVAVDWITGNVYVISYLNHYKIEVCSFQSKLCNRVVQVSAHIALKTLVVDAVNRRLFYVKIQSLTFGKPLSSVVALQLDGTINKTIFTKVGYISAIAVDTYKKLLYYVDSHERSLQAIYYNSGSNMTSITVINKENAIIYPSGLSIYENVAFIVNVGSKDVVKCNLYGETHCTSITLNVFNADNIIVDGVTRQKRVPNPCKMAHCSGMCVQSKFSYECMCHDEIISESQECMQVSNEVQADQVGASIMEYEEGKTTSFSTMAIVLIGILVLVVMALIVIGYILYKRKRGGDSFIVSMHFQNPLAGNVLHKPSTPNVLREKLKASTRGLFSKSNGSEVLVESEFYNPANTYAGGMVADNK